MTHKYRLTRRAALKTAAIGAVLPLVHIRTGHAAGKVSIAFWDHWVPEGNEVMKKQCAEWGAKHQVDVQADFVTSVCSKNILTIAAEKGPKKYRKEVLLPSSFDSGAMSHSCRNGVLEIKLTR